MSQKSVFIWADCVFNSVSKNLAKTVRLNKKIRFEVLAFFERLGYGLKKNLFNPEQLFSKYLESKYIEFMNDLFL